jgi:hypothetical protein
MNTRKKGPGRPKEPSAKGHRTMIRLDDEERAGLDALIRARNDELRAHGVSLKAPDVLRWLVAQELSRRGIHVEAPRPRG